MKKLVTPILVLVFALNMNQKCYSQDNESNKKAVIDTVKPAEKKLKFACGFGLIFV